MKFVNDFSPFAIRFGNSDFGIRWYGLAYVLGFVLAYWVLKRAVERGKIPNMLPKHVEALLYGIMAGVVLGGRLGYCVQNVHQFQKDPWFFFKFNQGGMAFFGGLAGVVIALFVFCKKTKVRFGYLGDTLAAPAALALGIGRIANFINGELWGIPTNADWGVIYPRAPGPQVLRHPSELYEMATHFLLAGILVWASRYKAFKEHPGLLSCLFVVGYGLLRVITENFRTADTYWGPLTNGQGASLIIAVIGVVAGAIVWKRSSATVEEIVEN